MTMNTVGLIYIIGMNLLGFALFGLDKCKARRGEWRIPERRLFLAAVLGGSLGAWIGMYVFRHKTKHWKFRVGIPGILLIQCLLVYVGISFMES